MTFFDQLKIKFIVEANSVGVSGKIVFTLQRREKCISSGSRKFLCGGAKTYFLSL